MLVTTQAYICGLIIKIKSTKNHDVEEVKSVNKTYNSRNFVMWLHLRAERVW